MAAGPWAVATDRAATPAPPGMHLACVVVPGGCVVSNAGARTSQREGWMHAGIACLKAESLGVDSSGSWVEGRGRVVDPRPLGVHVGCVLRLCGLLKGMVVRRTTGRGGAAALTPS